MPHDPYKALYVHIPFCVKRCGYCDFATRAIDVQSPEIDAYIEDLVMQIFRKSREGELSDIETVYLGGGTPSYIGQARLGSLLYALSTSMNLAKEGMECSMEANPESIQDRLIKDIWALGVNRLSVGVQSFDDDVLSILGRAHDSKGALHALELAHQRFENVSVDLMCGIPGQSDDSFAESVQTAIQSGVTHVSIYPLTIEEHTPFFRAVMAGTLPEPDEDVEASHMKIAERLLVEAGFNRYEVASYAHPGYECKHNKAYWTGVPYLGIGMSAATMTQNAERRMRVKDNQVTDDLNRAQMEAEDLMLGMRMSCGLSAERIETAREWLPEIDNCLEELQSLGLAKWENCRFKPTEQGWLCGNELYGRLFDLA